MINKSVFNWSGGKDSALALFHTLRDPAFQVNLLLTSLNGSNQRISMHGVREELLTLQAESIGIPLQKIMLPEKPSMAEYNEIMGKTMTKLRQEQYTCSIFGDIFLEDLKKYREEKLAEAGFKAHFPLWKRDTRELIRKFIALGFKTVVTCVNAGLLDQSFAGRTIDNDFLNDLPDNVDPCGENGEFHTFVFDGPIFKKPIAFEIGEKVFKEYKAPQSADSHSTSEKTKPASMGFWFCDLLPVQT